MSAGADEERPAKEGSDLRHPQRLELQLLLLEAERLLLHLQRLARLLHNPLLLQLRRGRRLPPLQLAQLTLAFFFFRRELAFAGGFFLLLAVGRGAGVGCRAESHLQTQKSMWVRGVSDEWDRRR